MQRVKADSTQVVVPCQKFVVFCAILAAALWTGAAMARPIQTITVSGNTLLADGHPWVPKGVNVVGLLSPRSSPYPKYAAAAAHWGPTELAAIRAYGADVVRFPVSQPGLDPRSPLYTPTYVGRIVQAVEQTRAMGLAVILSMQWEKPSGLAGQPSMPSAATARAWDALAPNFARDKGVMYELFNEPFIHAPRQAPINWREQWGAWQSAFQPLIDRVRRTGSRNILVIDGMLGAIIITGAPPLDDPLSQLAYAVHPYPRGNKNAPQFWNNRFGDFARWHPVIVTEWNTMSAYACHPDSPNIAEEFLAYTRKHRVGVIGWAFDVPGSLIKNFTFAPTDFSAFRCGQDGGNGAGAALRQEFLENSSE